MSIKIGQVQGFSSNYNNKKVNFSENSFSNVLEKSMKKDTINLNTSSNIVSPLYTSDGKGNTMTDDEKQTLIEDKAIYDHFNLKDKGIKFGSPEWEEWKKKDGSACIPRLNEPWQIRRGWREALDNCKTPAERKEVMELKLMLFASEAKSEEELSNKINSGSRVKDYLDFLGAQKSMYENIAKRDLSHSYEIFISTLGKLRDNIMNNVK
ncbi:hypothetical protein SAMN04487886_11372 [Clostridium sp. DSM 8431]|uniref:hypothetical protein n=1 Tax=Clostridium sp. DSM 8431 TaxID=1761781 RepID=UPI0008E3923E|nr:hypothetical protein [Clostridium sp. DSM 8431]SFU75543.1 hypothetical protein SAMN04487886_11372 [Clostridium sp. DSM 8431]